MNGVTAPVVLLSAIATAKKDSVRFVVLYTIKGETGFIWREGLVVFGE